MSPGRLASSTEARAPVELLALLDTPLVRSLPTPYFAVSEVAFECNLDRALELAGSADTLRPHIKTARSSWAITRMIERGIGNFKASTLAEAAALGECGARDVLLAYPLSGSVQPDFSTLCRKFANTRLSALVDSLEQMASWASPVEAFIDIDTGMGRTGIAADHESAALDLAEGLRRRGHTLRGLHVYDGQAAKLDEAGRRALMRHTADRLAVLSKALDAAGYPIGEVVAGGTHTLIEAATTTWSLPPTTALRFGPGTLFLLDTRSRDLLPAAAGFKVAAGVVSQVISRAPGRITVDCGLTSIQTDAGTPHLEVAGRDDLAPLLASQEHLVLESGESTELPQVGDRLILVPRHIDTSLIQFPEMLVLDEQGSVSWQPTILRRPAP